MPTTTIRLPDDLKRRVAKAAEQAGKSAHALILDAIAEHIDEAERRHAFHETAERRFARIVESGEAVSWDEMRAFLHARIAGEPVEPPKPRPVASGDDLK